MHSDKKITKEDTWRPADLRRHIREEGHDDVYVKRRDDNEKKHRLGESIERRRRDPEKESRQEQDIYRERERTKDRRDEDRKDRHAERNKEGLRDRRGDKERDRREERDKQKEKRKERERLVDGKKYSDDYRENRDRRRDAEEKQERERDKERHRDKEKDRVKVRERHNEDDRDKRREERDKERRREEREREHGSERDRRRQRESVEGGRDRVEKYDREHRDRYREPEQHKEDREEQRNDRERRERHGDRKHSERKEEREYREEHRRHKEERERRHKQKGHHDEKQKHDSESREHRYSKGSGEEERHHRGERERGEWDKHKERRHREEEDPEKKHRDRRHREEEDLERNHRDRTSSKKSSADKSHRHETNKIETEETEVVSEHWTTSVKDVEDTEEPVANDEDLADQEYEDDFEDYEEDFEEMDQSENEGEDEKEPEFPQGGEESEELVTQKRKEIEAIQRAMNEENERVETAQSRQSTSRVKEDDPKWSRGSEKKQNQASHRGKFIDFVAAKQREVSKKVATKQKKRSTELLRLIDLDFSMTFSLLDLPPVSEYDMYIRTFGTANTKQAYVQCNEDNSDRDIQTEEIELYEKWTQHPPEHHGACGDPNLSQEAREKNMNEMNFDSQRLTAFLQSASQVMVVLLEEDQAERNSLRKLRNQTDTLSFSDGSSQINTKLPFLYGRSISMVHFSQVQRHTMMSVHTPTAEPSAVRLDSCTIICIWNIWEPSRPQKILVYESEVKCCCFSYGKAILVFAGTSVGSVVLWDLRERASNHYHLKIGENEWTFRQPTFSTDAVMAGSGHLSSVTSVEVVPSTVAQGVGPEVPLLASEEESLGMSFQLASLDESGVLNFWVVVELPKANQAGSQTDLGLRPGGKVKLLHSSSLLTAERASPRNALKTGPLQTLHLQFLPTDSNHFFIGTNMGLVSHGTSHGLKALPKFYRCQEAGERPVDVSSIQFSPFRKNLFLVGCGDGSIRLHAVSHEQPVAEWKNSTEGEPVVSLQWTQTRPTVFCVLDAASNLYIWDLLKNDTEPVVTERMSADRVTAMAVFGDSVKQNTYSGIALVHESGKIEIQYYTRDFTVPIPAEEEKLESMINEAF